MVVHGEVRGAVIRDLQNFKNAAYALIFTVMLASFGTNWSTIKPRLTPPPTVGALPVYLGRIAVLVSVVVLILRWVAASTSELNLWISNLTIDSPRSHVFLSMFVLALVLGVMAFVSLQTFGVFLGYMVVYFAVNILAQASFNKHYARLRKHTAIESECHARIVVALDHYWLEQPQLGRLFVMFLFSLLALVLWLTAADFAARWQASMKLAAEFVFVFALASGEVVISIWRWRRDDAIEAAEDAANQ
jgi:hypothetical protein